ncbi:l-carnitine dehydratase/bile acid-inducible protein F [gamma proteobacterium HdN1]|nr:l-carnitine dehydratase/bile acid-inducible protein F [gamma proteobacterium HdN1]
MSQSLKGITVVALEQAVAAPYVSGRLARMGATVIKIERPEGDFARYYDSAVAGQSSYFVWLNAGKQSLVLDIKKPEDAKRLHALIAGADIFIQNLAPGAASRAGFDSLALRRSYPSLITCDISGYGEDDEGAAGAKRKAYDLLVQAESGLASITGSPEAPGRVGVSVCDVGAGMHALIGVLEALYERTHTGIGKGVKVSLFDGMADWMTVPLLLHDYAASAPSRVGLAHPGIAPYGVFASSDGAQVLLSIQNAREWRSLCENILLRPDWVTDENYSTNEARVRNRHNVDSEVQRCLGKMPRAQLIQRLQNADIAFGEINSVSQLSEHPNLRRISVDSPGGELTIVASPIRFQNNNGEIEPEMLEKIPALGENFLDV